jgi:hypothetical protein
VLPRNAPWLFEGVGQLLQTEAQAGLVVLRPQPRQQVLEHQANFGSPHTASSVTVIVISPKKTGSAVTKLAVSTVLRGGANYTNRTLTMSSYRTSCRGKRAHPAARTATSDIRFRPVGPIRGSRPSSLPEGASRSERSGPEGRIELLGPGLDEPRCAGRRAGQLSIPHRTFLRDEQNRQGVPKPAATLSQHDEGVR